MQNTANYLMMYAIVSGIIGAVSCFMGYKIFKIVFSLIGFLVGLTAGVAIAQKIMPGNQMGIIICGLVGGIITSGIIKFFFKIGLFITGAWTAVITVSMLFSIYKKAATPQG
ncbi:DUF4203 domain-containing protein, partial [bacterium]|nr:DUF4203 domain-containing protein [bacterium]